MNHHKSHHQVKLLLCPNHQLSSNNIHHSPLRNQCFPCWKVEPKKNPQIGTLGCFDAYLGKCTFDQTRVSGLQRRIDLPGVKILGQAVRKVFIVALHFLAISSTKAKKFHTRFVLWGNEIKAKMTRVVTKMIKLWSNESECTRGVALLTRTWDDVHGLRPNRNHLTASRVGQQVPAHHIIWFPLFCSFSQHLQSVIQCHSFSVEWWIRFEKGTQGSGMDARRREERMQGNEKLKTKNTRGEEQTQGEERKGMKCETTWNHKIIKIHS